MKTLLLLLFAFQLHAQPNLRIITGLEGDVDFPGLAGLPPHIGDLRSMTIVNHSPGYKFILFNLEILNRGPGKFDPSSVPGVVYTNEYGHIGIHGFLRVAITNTLTGVGLQRTSDLGIMLWDVAEYTPGLTKPSFGPEKPGISPGRIALVGDPFVSGTRLNIWGLPNGPHVITIDIDPFDKFKQRRRVRVPITLNDDQLTIDWPRI